MEYKLEKGKNSNYEITLTLEQTDMDKLKEKVLKQFQKEMDLKGFRKGHVPLDKVEQNIRPEYLNIGLYEEAIHSSLNNIIDENENIKFIGQIYDLNQDQKVDATIMTFKLDVYPEVEVNNENWKTYKIEEVDDTPTDEEIDSTILNLKKQYATYEDTNTIAEDCVFKVKLKFKNIKGDNIDEGSVMLGKEDIEEFPMLKKIFIGKDKGDKIEEKYNEKKLPEFLKCRNKDDKATMIKFIIDDVKRTVLPEFNEETLKKYFPQENIKDEEGFKKKITGLIQQQKKENLLMKKIDEMLEKSKSSLAINIPKTLIDEEVKTRTEAMYKNFGGEEKYKEYMQKLPEEQKEKMMNDLKISAQVSLEKFFLFRKVVELLDLKVDWKVRLDPETKVYEKMKK